MPDPFDFISTRSDINDLPSIQSIDFPTIGNVSLIPLVSADNRTDPETSLIDTIANNINLLPDNSPAYEYKAKEEKRYSNPYLQFTTNTRGRGDIENVYAENQSSAEQLFNSVIVKLPALTGATFVSSFYSIPANLDLIRSGKAIEAFKDDATFSAVQNWTEGIEDMFPNYYTQWERDHPYLSIVSPTGFANVWGDKVIKNIGFTAGGLAAGLVQSAAIEIMTAGTGTPFAFLKAAQSITGSVGQMVRGFRNLSKLGALGKVDDVVRGLEYTKDTLGTIQSVSRLNQIKTGANLITTAYLSSQGEAFIEGYHTYIDTKKQLLEEAINSNNLNADTIAEIEKKSMDAGRYTTGFNIPLLMGSQLMQFSTVLGGKAFGTITKGYIGKQVGKEGVKVTTDQTFRKSLWAWTKESVKDFASEGLEEGSQFFIGNSLHDYYTDKIDPQSKKSIAEFMIGNVPKVLQDKQFWEEAIFGGLSGFTMGAPASIPKYFNKSKTQSTVEHLNSVYDNFNKSVKNLSHTIQLQDTTNNPDGKHNADIAHKALFSTVHDSVRMGAFDMHQDILDDMKSIPFQDFNKTFGTEFENEQEKLAHVESIVNESNQIKKDIINTNKYFMNNPFTQNKLLKKVKQAFTSKSDYEIGNIQERLFEDFKELAAFNQSRLRVVGNSLSDKITSLKSLGAKDESIQYLISIAGNPKGMGNYMQWKSIQLDSLNKSIAYLEKMKGLGTDADPSLKADMDKEYKEAIKRKQFLESYMNTLSTEKDQDKLMQVILMEETTGEQQTRFMDNMAKKMKEAADLKAQKEGLEAEQEDMTDPESKTAEKLIDLNEQVGEQNTPRVDADKVEPTTDPTKWTQGFKAGNKLPFGDKPYTINQVLEDTLIVTDDKGIKYKVTQIDVNGQLSYAIDAVTTSPTEQMQSQAPIQGSNKKEKIESFILVKISSLKRIKNSNDPQKIFSEINRIQVILNLVEGATLTNDEKSLIESKLKELKDQGYTFETNKGKIYDFGMKVSVQNMIEITLDDITNEEKIIIKQELNKRKKRKQTLIENGYTEKEAINESGSDDSIDIISSDIAVVVKKDGIQVSSGIVEVRVIKKELAEKLFKEEVEPSKTTVNSDITFENAKEGDVVFINDEKVEVVSRKKSRNGNDLVEVKTAKRTKEEIRKAAIQNVLNRKISEYNGRKVLIEQFEQDFASEIREEIEKETAIENSRTSTFTIDAEQWVNEVNSVEPTQDPVEEYLAEPEVQPATFKERKDEIEKNRKEDLSNIGIKQIQASLQKLRESKTPEEKLNAINLIERNVAEGATLSKKEQQEIQGVKDNLASEGYEVPELLGKKFYQGMKVIKTSSIPDENLAEDEEIITKIVQPQINKDDKMVQTAKIEVTVGTKKGGLTREQWLAEQKKKKTRRDNINAKYDAQLLKVLQDELASGKPITDFTVEEQKLLNSAKPTQDPVEESTRPIDQPIVKQSKEEIQSLITNNIGKEMVVNGIKGTITNVNENLVELETKDTIYEIDIDRIDSIAEPEIETTQDVIISSKYKIEFKSENTVVVNGETYTMNLDKNWTITSLSPLSNPKQKIKNKELIIAVEIERNKTEMKSEIKDLSQVVGDSTVAEVLTENNFENLNTLLDTIYGLNLTEVVESGLEKLYNSEQLTEQEKLQVGLWLTDAFDRLSKLFNRTNTEVEKETLLNAYDNLEIILSLLYDLPLKTTTKEEKNEKQNNIGKTEVDNTTKESKRKSETQKDKLEKRKLKPKKSLEEVVPIEEDISEQEIVAASKPITKELAEEIRGKKTEVPVYHPVTYSTQAFTYQDILDNPGSYFSLNKVAAPSGKLYTAEVKNGVPTGNIVSIEFDSTMEKDKGLGDIKQAWDGQDRYKDKEFRQVLWKDSKELVKEEQVENKTNKIDKIKEGIKNLGKSILSKLGYKNQNRLDNGNVKGGQDGWKIRFNIKNPKTGESYYDEKNPDTRDAEYNKRAETISNFLLSYFGSNEKADSKNLQKHYILEDSDGNKRKPFKHLSGGEIGESDFTIYIGSADDVIKFISDIRTKHPEILELLHAGNQSSDIKIDDVFKGRIEGRNIGFSGYHIPTNLNQVLGTDVFNFIFDGKNVRVNYEGMNLSDIYISVEGSNKAYRGVFDKELKKDYPELYKNLRNIIGFQLYGNYLQGSNGEFIELTGVSNENSVSYTNVDKNTNYIEMFFKDKSSLTKDSVLLLINKGMIKLEC